MRPVLINGVNYAWTSFNSLAFGIPMIGITKLEWSREQVKENNYGAGPEPISRGYGEIKYSGTMTLYKDLWQAICKSAVDQDPLQIAPFDWTILYGDSATAPFTETLKYFEFTKDGASGSQGDTKLLQEVPFIFAGLIRKTT